MPSLMPNKYQTWFFYNKGYALFKLGAYKYDQYKYDVKGEDNKAKEAKKDFVGAVNCFMEALNRCPDYADAWLIRAISLYYIQIIEFGNREKTRKRPGKQEKNTTSLNF